MGLGRARGVALILAGVVAGSLTAVVPAAASAGHASAPSVTLRQTGADAVTVSGRTAKASPKVRFHRRTASGWTFVKRVRARHHRYTTTLSVAAGTTATFRVTSSGRSRTFTVTMPAKPRPTQYDACGARPLKADGSAWSCTFVDEFDGSTLDPTKWLPQETSRSGYLTGDKNAGYPCYVDDPDNIAVAGGMLSLTVRKEAAPVSCGTASAPISSWYTAGSVSTYHLFSQQYGRFEARIRNTASDAPGLQETFWLWPDDRYSVIDPKNTGEIDVSETYSVYNTLSIPFLHYAAAPSPQAGVNTAYGCTAYRGQWNTYVLEWGPSSLSIYVNGKPCLTNTSADPAFRTRHIVAFTQALGAGTDAMTSATPIPATMDVDYVRVWS